MDKALESIVAVTQSLSQTKNNIKKENDCFGGHLTSYETPDETYYRRNLGRVSRVQAMDKALESIVVAAQARLLGHFLIQNFKGVMLQKML